MKEKCVHTIVIDNWNPELCRITLPNLKSFAKRINADFNIITKAKFTDYPPNYERLQVWDMGKDYKWNLVIDADTILHTEFIDPTTIMPIDTCGSLHAIDPRVFFKRNIYFERDIRNIGLADSFVVSSYLTHNLWHPLDIPFSEAKKAVLKDERQVSEYCLSLNLSKYELTFHAIATDHTKHFSASVTTNSISSKDAVKIFKNKLKEWNKK